jgi:hypothetical protein
MKSFGSMRKNFNIPSPKSQSPKKDPAPKARRPLLNPDASPHANRLARPPRFPEICEEDEDAPEDDNRCQSPTPVTRRKKPRSTSSTSQHHVLARPSSSPPPHLQAPIVATIRVDIDESLLKQNKKRISRRQSGLITVGSGNSSSGSTSSSTKSRTTSPPPRAPSPAFGSPLRRDAGLAEEEEEYAAVHGHRRVDLDEDVELERASSRGKKKRTLAQAQAEEAPAPAEGGREREKRRIREDFEVAAQRLQDVTNAFGTTRASLPPLDTNVFGICLPANPRWISFADWSAEQDRQRSPTDTDSDMPSSALTYSSTRPPLSTPGTTPGTTPAPSHLPTPRNSSPPPIPLPGSADAEASTTGRERRVRKSINYAEPKLNTCVPYTLLHPRI